MDIVPTGVRERIWIAKMDHSTDPPVCVERVFIENGVVMKREHPNRETETIAASDVGSIDVVELGMQPIDIAQQQEKEPSDVEPKTEAESERRRRESGGR